MAFKVGDKVKSGDMKLVIHSINFNGKVNVVGFEHGYKFYIENLDPKGLELDLS